MIGKNDIVQRLASVRTNIADLLTDTEKDFLYMGDKISEFTERSDTVLANTKSATDILSGKNMRILIDDLKEILNRINRYLKFNSTQFEQNLDIFDSILKVAKSGQSPIRQLERRVMELRMLGISTRIESAHLKSEHSSFDTLSMDVNSLSDQIRTKIEMIQGGLVEAHDQVKSAFEQIRENKYEQDQFAQNIFGNIQSCINTLEDKHNQSVELVNIVMNSNTRITQGVHEIVGSLQIHDITRQKLEHIDMALEEIALINDNNDDAMSDAELIKVGDVCILQAKQLSVSRQELLDAINALISHTNEIVDNSQVMTAHTRELIDKADLQNHSFCTNIDQGIEYVITTLRNNAVIFFEMGSTTKGIVEKVDEMTLFIRDIKEIGTNISLIALNAIINAEHLHHEGASLSVLANGIQHLAGQTRSEIDSVANTLSGITGFAEQLSNINKTENQEQTINNVVDGMAKSLTDILDQLNNMFESASLYLEKVEKEGRQLYQDMQKNIMNIEVHNIFDEKINISTDLLGELVQEIQNTLPDYDSREREIHTQELWNNYSMHSERIVHESFIDDNNMQSAQDDELGDNVELF